MGKVKAAPKRARKGARQRAGKGARGPAGSGSKISNASGTAAPAGAGVTGSKISNASGTPKLGGDAYLGPVGDFLAAVRGYTEATDEGILAHLLPAAGALAGPRVYVWGGGEQPARLFTAVVGPTNSGRKGTAKGPVDQLMRQTAADWWGRQCVSGLSSGEGLIDLVADRVTRDEDGNEQAEPVEKRAYVVEPELSRVLVAMRREGCVLSQVIREAFDSGNLAALTVRPRRAFGAHVSITGHITPDELAERLTAIDQANGWGNRFLWFRSHSEKVLADTEPIPASAFAPFAPRLRAVKALGDRAAERPVKLAGGARGLWAEVYPKLREDRPGLAGAMVARGAPIVLRLALTYALLTAPLRNLAVSEEHLRAALAVWAFCEASAEMLFNTQTGDPFGDRLLSLLAGGPLARSEINRHLSNRQKGEAGPVLVKLERLGFVLAEKVYPDGAGKPATVWKLAE